MRINESAKNDGQPSTSTEVCDKRQRANHVSPRPQERQQVKRYLLELREMITRLELETIGRETVTIVGLSMPVLKPSNLGER